MCELNLDFDLHPPALKDGVLRHIADKSKVAKATLIKLHDNNTLKLQQSFFTLLRNLFY